MDGTWKSTSTRPTPDELSSLQLGIKQDPDSLADMQRARAVSGKNLPTEEDAERKEQRRLKRKRAQQNKKQKWFESKQSTFVYATGLPKDVQIEEVTDFFKKCGRIAKDVEGQ